MEDLIAQVNSFGAIAVITAGAISWLNNLNALHIPASIVTVTNVPESNQIAITITGGKITNFMIIAETFPV